MPDPQKIFDQLLECLKHPTPEQLASELDVQKELREFSIKIMESGIFHKGGLKGKKLAVSGPPDFRHYKILNLEILVNILSQNIRRREEGNYPVLYEGDFNRLLKKLAECEGELEKMEEYTGKTVLQDLRSIRTKLIARQNNILKKANPGSKTSLAMIFLCEMSLFVPKSPALNIAERANELLKVLGKKSVSKRTLTDQISRLKDDPHWEMGRVFIDRMIELKSGE
jgi:hypothetical protein